MSSWFGIWDGISQRNWSVMGFIYAEDLDLTLMTPRGVETTIFLTISFDVLTYMMNASCSTAVPSAAGG